MERNWWDVTTGGLYAAGTTAGTYRVIATQQCGTLADTFGWLVGVGPGAGFGLLIFLCGIGGILVGLSGYLVRDIRNLHQRIQDYQPASSITNIRQAQAVFITGTGLQEPEHSDALEASPGGTVETVPNEEETQKSRLET